MQRLGEKRQGAKRRRTNKLKARKAPTTAYVATADLQEQLGRALRERDEALEQQKATSEILKVISSKPGELEPVFKAMLENATRICEAKFGLLLRFDGQAFQFAAEVGTPLALAQFVRNRGKFQPMAGSHLDHVMRTKRVSHTVDYATEGVRPPPVTLGGARSTVDVPLVKDDELVGVFSIYRQEVRPFTDKQIALLQNFAAQAVIAIENARLFNELQESLEQQTATSEVLRVISASPGELDAVFAAMLQNAVRICGAEFGNLWLREGDVFRIGAMHGTPKAYADFVRKQGPFHPDPRLGLGTIIATKRPFQTEDIAAVPAHGDKTRHALIELAGARTLIGVPMLKDNEVVGAIGIYRQQVRPFTDTQIELVKNFAAQAVIAIENARLLNELRDSLVRQTATSELLQVITSSPGKLVPVFSKMLENAARICEANFGTLVLEEEVDKGAFRVVAMHNAPPKWAEKRTDAPVFKPGPLNNVAIVKRTGRAQHVRDLQLDPSYLEGEPAAVAIADLGGARTLAVVPLLNKNEVIGVFGMYRQEVRPFTDEQINLLADFAAQAVIAIENARLLSELNSLNQKLEQRVADQVNEIERMSKLRRFLPPQVADLIVASGSEKQLESHRREITALFCDLRGFTGFSESADPEDVMSLLREYHAAIGEIINKYSGTLERYAGDGVMVIFNDPVPVANPALQAVRMALDMRVALGALIDKWRRLGHDLGFGIGIAHGYATLGTIGFEGRFDYAAIGTVSNVASRLCDEAKPGQILISPRVLLAIEDAVSVEDIGEFELKGIRRPLKTYNVISMKA